MEQGFALFIALRLNADDVIAEERRDHDGNDPREQQRGGDDGKERGAELRCHALRESDGDEACACDERARQHGKRRRTEGVRGGAEAVKPLFELDAHHLDGDDLIVDQKPEGDDERTQRHLLQVDARTVHEEEDARQYERDAAGDDEPRTKAERQKAHGEHDDDGFSERVDEIIDGFCDDLRLVGDLMDFQAERQVVLERGDFLLQILAERQDVAARAHGNGDAHGRLAIEVHLRLGRLGIAARDARNVTEAEGAPAGGDRQGADRLKVVESARDAHIDVVRLRLDHARRRHLFLRADGRKNRVGRYAKLRETLARGLDVDLLRLHADQFDLLYVFDRKQGAARLFRLLAHLLVGPAVARHGVDRTEDIVEAVVVIRAVNACGQAALLILAEIACVAPRRTNILLRHIVVQRHIDDRLSLARIALELLESRHILQLLLQLVRDLLFHLLRCRTRPGDGHDHLADREVRIFHPAELAVGKNAADKDDENEIPDETLVLERDFRKIPHGASPVRTSSPSRSLWTPAVTTRAPSGSPRTSTSLPS